MDNFVFYVVGSDALEFRYEMLNLQQRRNRLRELVKQRGARWKVVRLRGENFLRCVEALAGLIAAPGLADLTYENSPRDVLPAGRLDEYDPMFGYFDAVSVQTFDRLFRSLAHSAALLRFENEDPHGSRANVLNAYFSTFAEAAFRRAAVAIDHS